MQRNYNYSICVYDDRGNVLEWLAELDDWAMAKAAFGVACEKRSDDLIVWRQGARVVEEWNPKEL